MSFGFSVGDIIAVGKLVADIVSCLKDSTGSQVEYRDLVRELECLQSALVHLDRLTQSENSQCLDSIKYAALSCSRPLEEFLAKIRKYDRSLGIQSKSNLIREAIDKIRFPLSHSDEIRKLQAYLSVHIGSINFLLAEYGFERIALAASKSEADHLQITQRLENNAGLLNRMHSSISRQALAVSKSMSMLEKVYKIISGELQASLKSFEGMVARVCVSTQQIHSVILEIQTSIARVPDLRWTFFQDPVILEDALGRKFPVPSEYDFPLLDAIIKCRFQEGPGSAYVAADNYEIMDARNRLHVLSADSQLRPGGALTMAIVVGMPPSIEVTEERCPIPGCRSGETKKASGGGRLCCKCNVWFDLSTKRPRGLRDLWETHKTLSNARTEDHASKEKKRKRPLNDDLSMVPFKNVKVANFEEAQNKLPIMGRTLKLQYGLYANANTIVPKELKDSGSGLKTCGSFSFHDEFYKLPPTTRMMSFTTATGYLE